MPYLSLSLSLYTHIYIYMNGYSRINLTLELLNNDINKNNLRGKYLGVQMIENWN